MPSDRRKSAGRVIAGFPAVGKSYIATCRPDVVDSDSSSFSRGPEWPENYLDHIREQVAAGKIVLVSTHEEVREALRVAGIPYLLVYPGRDLREEYRDRMLNRGSHPALIAKVCDELWDDAITGCVMQMGCVHVELGPGQYLVDVIE